MKTRRGIFKITKNVSAYQYVSNLFTVSVAFQNDNLIEKHFALLKYEELIEKAIKLSDHELL